MNNQQFFDLISGQPMPGGRLLRFLLRLAAFGYGFATWVRNQLFDWRLRRIHATSIPVVSVGNLTTGGTGKTPVVALIIQHLSQSGRHPGIVSRGYRSLDDEGNDEARVLELLCPGVPHVQNSDRVEAVRLIPATTDVVVADDAFQHRRLRRALDIVLIDALNPWGYGYVLPRGMLRESISGLKRADLIVVTRADQIDESARAEIWSRIRTCVPHAPQIEIAFEPASLISHGSTEIPVSDLTEQVFAFCGIGNPEAFRMTLERMSIELVGFRQFPDHYHYEESDVTGLVSEARELGANTLVTTVKDLVKIEAPVSRRTIEPSSRILALDIRARFLEGEREFHGAVDAVTRPHSE